VRGTNNKREHVKVKDLCELTNFNCKRRMEKKEVYVN